MNPYGCDEWQEVDSSNISAVGSRGDYLVILFKKGNVAYRYPGIAEEFDNLVNADSVGKYFAQDVRHQVSERLLPDIWPED